jgi:predicted Fe-S protein YdhL (DUF1289 family)
MIEAPVPSPCNKVCTMDPSGAYCIGCHRTLDEIARWGSMTPEERRGVMRELPGRLAARDQADTAARG